MAKNNPYTLKFNGSNSYVDCGNVCNMGTDDITALAWIKTTSLANQYFISKAKAAAQKCRYGVRTRDGYASTFMQGNGGADVAPLGNIFIADNEWHQITAVFHRNSSVFIYVDGILDTSADISHWKNVNMQSNNPFRIGSYTASDNNSPSIFFNGLIDNVSIWNKALTQEEIQYYMDRKLDGDEESLVGYWTLDEGKGNIAYDLTLNKNYGTIYNAEWTEGEVDLKTYNNTLLKSNNKYYTYRNNEFIEVEPTIENFEEYNIDLSQLTTSTDKAILTMEGGEKLGDGKIYRKTIDISKYKDIERIEIK